MKIPKRCYNPCDDCQYGKSKQNQRCNMCDICEFKMHLKKARHTGYWRESDELFFCSACNNGYKNQPTLMGQPMFEYCPICGSKMKKGGVKSEF